MTFRPKYKDSKTHIWNSFFENIISDILFYIQLRVPRFLYSSTLFFNFGFSSKKVSKTTKASKKDHSFYNTVSL